MRAIPVIRLRRISGRYGQGLSIRSALRCATVFLPPVVIPTHHYPGDAVGTLSICGNSYLLLNC